MVQSVRKVVGTGGGIDQEEIGLHAVYGPTGTVNAQWSRWTPSASVQFTISNPDAFDKVLPGQYYYLDFIATTQDDPVA